MTEATEETPFETGQKKAEDTVDAAKSRASRLMDEAGHAASDMASGAKARVEAEIAARGGAARDSVATAIEDGADTLRTAAERMSQGTPQSEAVNRAAEGVSGVANQIRETSADDAIETMSRFARQHPGPFLAGAALAGFAAGRFLKASSRTSEDRMSPPPAARHASPAERTAPPASGPDRTAER